MSELSERILGFDDPFVKLHPYPIPEWGATVYLKGNTAKERDRLEQQFGDLEKAGRDNLRARILVKVLLDENGKRIFTDDQAEQLGEQQAPILDDLFDKALYFAGMKKDQRENALKNLPAGQAGSNGSALHEPTVA